VRIESRKITALIVICLVLMFPHLSFSTSICVKDLNGNGTIEQDTERWQCRGSGTIYSCPYGAVECTSLTYTVSGSAATIPTGISGKNAITAVSAKSGSKEIEISAWTCPTDASSCISSVIGALQFSQGNVSGSVTAGVITKIVGSGEKLSFYGCAAAPCSSEALIGTITVSGADFSGSVSANYGFLSAVSSADGTQIIFTGYYCTSGSGCQVKSAGYLTLAGNSYSCPSGSQYACVTDPSDSKKKCSTENCFDDTMMGEVGLTGKICVADLDGNGMLDYNNEVAQCSTVDSKDFCPLGVKDCEVLNEDPVCPSDATQCPTGGSYNSTTSRCEANLAVLSYACPLTNASFTSLGACQDGCKITAVCATSEVSANGFVAFGQEGFASITGGNGTLSFTAGSASGNVNVVNCNFSGTVTANAGSILNRIKAESGQSLLVYDATDAANPKGSIIISGCTATGEINSPAGKGFTALTGANKSITGMWPDSQYSNGTSIAFAADASAGTNCLLGSSYPCTDGDCSKGGDCLAVDGCPTGYTKLGAENICVAAAGGATFTALYIDTKDRCELSKTPNCPDGYTYDQATNLCAVAPVCPNGGTLDTAADKCLINATTLCPASYTYNASIDACQLTPPCPAGSTYSTTVDKCVLTATFGCPAGTAWNDATSKCEAASTMECAAGLTWDESLGKCRSSATCLAGGILETISDKCQIDIVTACPDGYAWNNSTSKCEKDPTCSPGTYSASADKCTLAYTSMTCPTGGTYNSSTGYCEADKSTPTINFNSCYVNCSGGSLIASGNTIYVSGCGCQISVPGATFTGNLYLGCDVTQPRQPEGCSQLGYAYGDYITSGCSTMTVTGASVSGSVVSGWAGMAACSGGNWLGTGTPCPGSCMLYFYALPQCPSGYTWNESRGKCIVSPTFVCPAGTYNSTLGLCVVTPMCENGGILNGTLDKCQANMSSACATGYTWNSTSSKCEAAPVCQSGASYNASSDACLADKVITCPSGSAYNSIAGLCQGDKRYNCGLSGFVYDSGAGLCVEAVSCPDGGTINATRDMCEILLGSASCPAGQTFNTTNDTCEIAPPCTQGGTYSPERDRCEIAATVDCPTGYSWDYTSQVCYSAPACVDGTYDATLKKCKGNVSCPYGDRYQCLTSPTTGALQCSPYVCADLASSTTESQADLTGYTDDGKTGASGCEGTIYVFNGKAGECRPSGLQTLFMDCCDEDEDKFLFMKENCTDMEYKTAIQKSKKYCHKVGDYCKLKWDASDSLLGGAIFGTIIGIGPIILPELTDCLQAGETYCCFSGILARVIHEQGRRQIKSFQGNEWGTPEAPNCRGFTTNEFAMLDFSKMDLSEYYNVIVDQVKATVNTSAATVKAKVEAFFNESIKK